VPTRGFCGLLDCAHEEIDAQLIDNAINAELLDLEKNICLARAAS